MSIGAPGFHLDHNGLPNKQDLELATQIRLRSWTIKRGFTIPYVAGWDESERVVYVDEFVPETWDDHGRILKVIEGGLFWHESMESDTCREYPDEHYPGGHTIATYFEHGYYRAFGFDPQRVENELWAPIIEKCAARKSFPRVPATMSLHMYREEGDAALLKKMTFVKV